MPSRDPLPTVFGSLAGHPSARCPSGRILGGRQHDRLGDIDVLCWDPAKHRAWLLECKDLHFHKSIGEMAEQVQDFRGRTVGKRRDPMRKHIDRTAAIRADPVALQRYLGSQDQLAVGSCVVFRTPCPDPAVVEPRGHRRASSDI